MGLTGICKNEVAAPSAGRIRSLSALSVLGFLLFWQCRVTGQFSVLGMVVLAGFVGLCLSYGVLFAQLTKSLLKLPVSSAWLFLTGYLSFNFLLFVLTLALPWGMTAKIIVLIVVVSLGIGLCRRRGGSSLHVTDDWLSLSALWVMGIASSIWCNDIQLPRDLENGETVFRVWQDVFIHLRHISAFANVHGAASIGDIFLSGHSAPIYHYASYLSAAAVSNLAGMSAIDVYASFMLPLGLMLLGFAAFALIDVLFGRAAAVVAVVAALAIPDGYLQGSGNRYLSAHFLGQVNLGMLYGVACISVAWVFMLQGCRQARLGAVLVAYGFLGVCLFYKAHVFIANAYLLLVFPCLLFAGLKTWQRLLMAALFTAVFVSVVNASQVIGRVPVLRLDGSGLQTYVAHLLDDFDPGMWRSFWTDAFKPGGYSKALQGTAALAMLLLGTFGVWLPTFVTVWLVAWRRLDRVVLALPLLVLVNYVVMALGLAMDSRGVGTADELLNRPLVWAYFVISVWTAGAAWHLAAKRWSYLAVNGPAALSALSVAALMTMWLYTPNLQTFPMRDGFGSYAEFNAYPSCWVRAANYIRLHAAPDEVAHDASNDARLMVMGMAERQRYAGAVFKSKPPAETKARLDNVAKWLQMSDPHQIALFAQALPVHWLLVHPDTALNWPEAMHEHMVFACNGYRVLQLVGSQPR